MGIPSENEMRKGQFCRENILSWSGKNTFCLTLLIFC
jgi:hypothetical protein